MKIATGAEVDLTEYGVIISAMVRVGSRLGLKRRSKDITPTLQQYLNAKAKVTTKKAKVMNDDREA